MQIRTDECPLLQMFESKGDCRCKTDGNSWDCVITQASTVPKGAFQISCMVVHYRRASTWSLYLPNLQFAWLKLEAQGALVHSDASETHRRQFERETWWSADIAILICCPHSATPAVDCEAQDLRIFKFWNINCEAALWGQRSVFLAFCWLIWVTFLQKYLKSLPVDRILFWPAVRGLCPARPSHGRHSDPPPSRPPSPLLETFRQDCLAYLLLSPVCLQESQHRCLSIKSSLSQTLDSVILDQPYPSVYLYITEIQEKLTNTLLLWCDIIILINRQLSERPLHVWVALLALIFVWSKK